MDLEYLKSEIAQLRNSLPKMKESSLVRQEKDDRVSLKIKEDNLVNLNLDYWKLANQFLNRERLGRQSSKAKLLVKFVKFLESQF